MINTLLIIHFSISILCIITIKLIANIVVHRIRDKYPNFGSRNRRYMSDFFLTNIKLVLFSFIPLFNIFFLFSSLYASDKIVEKTIREFETKIKKKENIQ